MCRYAPRVTADIRPHSRNASSAADTAAEASEAAEDGNSPITSSESAGLTLEENRSLLGFVQAPLMKF